MRRLATIQRIEYINDIEGADFIQCAGVLGWQTIIKKGQFNVGDLCLWFEIDSFLESKDLRYEFLEKRFINWGDKKGYRVKTQKMKGVLSQGLAMSLELYPEIRNPQLDDDMTEFLGIEKWETLEENTNNNCGYKSGRSRSFPKCIPRTDEPRIQNVINHIKNHMNETYEVTYKLHGSSMTVFSISENSLYWKYISEINNELKGINFIHDIINKILVFFKLRDKIYSYNGVCSRNLWVMDEKSHFIEAEKKYNIFKKLNEYCLNNSVNYALQGELIGPNINSNYECVEDLQYHIFQIWDIDKQEYLKPADMRMAVLDMKLDTVPIETYCFRMEKLDYLSPQELIDFILKYAEGPGMNSWKNKIREGLVFKSNETDFSFKAVSNRFLLNEK